MKSLKKVWYYFSYLGIKGDSKTFDNRNIIITNQLNLLLSGLLFLLYISYAIIRQFNHLEPTIHSQKVLVLLLICIFNILLSRFYLVKIVKMSLVLLPAQVVVIIPILLGTIQEADFVYAPMLILCSAFIPQLILLPRFSNPSYLLSILYYFILIITIDNLIVNFSPKEFGIVTSIPSFHLYYKLVIFCVFTFINITTYYLRNQSYYYEVELNNYNQQLEETLKKLKQTQDSLIDSEKMASLGIFTAGIAHEINNPLNYIQNGLLIIKRHIENKVPEQVNDLKKLFTATDIGIMRINEIVKSLNNYSRSDNQRNTIYNVNTVINECLTILNNQYKNRIEITKNFEFKELAVKAGDGKLHQVFTNLLANAMQAILKEGNITITTTKNLNKAIISITDDGCGISPANLKTIYEPFFTTKDPGKGTGLGLSITKKIIQEHDGYIRCESQPSIGTTFSIILPLYITTDNNE